MGCSYIVTFPFKVIYVICSSLNILLSSFIFMFFQILTDEVLWGRHSKGTQTHQLFLWNSVLWLSMSSTGLLTSFKEFLFVYLFVFTSSFYKATREMFFCWKSDGLIQSSLYSECVIWWYYHVSHQSSQLNVSDKLHFILTPPSFFWK